MKSQLKRSLSILIALVMVICLLPTVTFAASQTLDMSNRSGTGWSYTASTKTLSLDNYNGSDLFTLAKDDSIINVTGINTITISESATTSAINGVRGYKGLTIKGSGTLNINVSYTGSDLRSNINAINVGSGGLTIGENVTVAINVESHDDFKSYGIHAKTGIEVKDSANLSVTMQMPADGYESYAVYTKEGEVKFDGTGTKTITCNATAANANRPIHGIYNEANNSSLTNNGDITIKGTGKTTITATEYGNAIFSDININANNVNTNTDGLITLENTEVDIKGGKFGILSGSNTRTAAEADIVVKNSTLNMENVKNGIGSLRNGINLDNSAVSVTAENYAIDLYKPLGSTYLQNSSEYILHISGTKSVLLESSTGNTIANNNLGKPSTITFTSGGSLTVKAPNTTNVSTSSEKFNVTLGENTKVTTGANSDDFGVEPEVVDNKKVFVIKHQTAVNLSVEFTSAGDGVCVQNNTASGVMLIVASYDSDGRVVELKTSDILSGQTVTKTISELGLNQTGAAKIKAMLWSNLSAIEPLVPPATLEL